MRFLIYPMNTFRTLTAIVFLLLPLSAPGRDLQPCDKVTLHYRNLENQAITKVKASYPNEPGVFVKGKVIVLIKVDRGGNVYYARVLCGHPLLASSSVAAAFRWKFSTRRVSSAGIIAFHFAPNDGARERISAIERKRA